MAGHSKWVNTKYRKASQNAKRGKIFTKIIHELVIASKLGGSDINFNPRLRVTIDKALANNMTRDTINRAVARGTGREYDAQMEAVVYEGYGPGGTAVIVECLSDNRKRTLSEIRHVFTTTGGNLSTYGSVLHLFNKRGVIYFAPGLNENTIMNIAVEAGADDIIVYDDGAINVYTTPDSFNKIKDAFKLAGLTPEFSEISLIPSINTDLDEKNKPKFQRLIKMLEDLDDVQEVHHNGRINDRMLENPLMNSFINKPIN